jgi:hypothetical protein
MSIGAFGTGVTFIESEGDELRYRSVHSAVRCFIQNPTLGKYVLEETVSLL